MTTSSTPDLATLLGDDFSFKFVGEGAANIIFEIIQPPSTDIHPLLQDKLIRVPKARTNSHALTLNYTEVQSYWEAHVRPLFNDDDLVTQSLVHLSPCSSQQALILSRMKEAVAVVEASLTRRKDFRGSNVATTEWAMLVDDMRARKPGEIVLEFKPKWLAQSPDAPPDAIRCRNCAKEWLRYHDKLTKKKLKPPKSVSPGPKSKTDKPDRQLPLPVLCTIDLLNSSSDRKARERVLERLTSSTPSSRSTVSLTDVIEKDGPQYRALSSWLEHNSLLKRLAHAQRENDDAPWGGCLGAEIGKPHPKLYLAMTLRDCTCFVRISSEQLEVEAKLGDLDKKNGEAKLPTWKELERRLIDEGLYTRRRPRGEWTCALEREDNDGEGEYGS
ncbi:hypothetical protein V8F20_006799 [Naviculisporaceae sp. PSN 640]